MTLPQQYHRVNLLDDNQVSAKLLVVKSDKLSADFNKGQSVIPRKVKLALIIVIGLAVSLIVALYLLHYFSPYQTCLRSMRVENKSDAEVSKACLWKHYMIGNPPQTTGIKPVKPAPE